MIVTKEKTIKTYYEALLTRNQSYVGIFYVGVKTTSVFCIATCRARKPKLKKVIFYTTFKEALLNGYRPCKICKPTENANEAPEMVQSAITLIKNNPKEKITDVRLKQLGLSPSILRRWFNKNYGMTFQTYQRMYRINAAYEELKHGKNTTHTALDAGYDSLSGFGYTFKKLVGESPNKSLYKNLILLTRFTTPLGPMFSCVTEKGLCLLEFIDDDKIETTLSELQKLFSANIISGENRHSIQTKKEIGEYFKGSRKEFNVTLDLGNSLNKNLVWKSLLEIEYGTTIALEEHTKKVAIQQKVKEINLEVKNNRISIIIPSHRVILSNEKTKELDGSLERVKWLRQHEFDYK